MATCNQDYVTPTMIKKGQVEIGDKISFEEPHTKKVTEGTIPAQSNATYNQTGQTVQTQRENSNSVYNQTQYPPQPSQVYPSPIAPSPNSQDTSANPKPIIPGEANWQNPNAENPANPTPVRPGQAVPLESIPLIFDQMTEYAESLSDGNKPMFQVPSSPLVPPQYEQTIDYDSMQYMNGFLRTQIGRYLRAQQLIGSGNTVDRYGFLVGVGNNYILLQDITNGNIMLLDFYTVKFIYFYYSQPVFPYFTPQNGESGTNVNQ